MEYLKIFTDFEEVMEPLTDAERGRLFTAMLKYADTGELPQLSGNERYTWPAAKQQIDRARAESERMRANGGRGGRPRQEETNENQTKPNETNENQSEPNESQKDKDKDNENRGTDDENRASAADRAREGMPCRVSDIIAGKHLVMSDGAPIPDLRTSPDQDKMTAVAMYSLAESVPGLNAPPRLAQRLADVAREYNLSDRMLRAAILSAENANSPVAYAIGVMQDMAEHHDRTPGEWRMRREEGCSA